MKKNIKILYKYVILLSLLITVGCNEEELIIFNPETGQTALSFGQTSYNLSIPQEDLTITVPVGVTTISNTDRSYEVSVVSATEGTSSEYSFGSITIPAGSYSGSLDVNFDFSSIGGNDGDVKDLSLSFNTPNGVSSYNDALEISYFREIVCNDLNLTIISDVWATETYYTVEKADGTVLVDRFFPFSGNSTSAQTYEINFNLPDGDYVLKIGDVFGDGQLGTGGGVTLTGSYKLSCSIINHAQGEGEFVNTPDPFPGAPDAVVEVTNFSVNP